MRRIQLCPHGHVLGSLLTGVIYCLFFAVVYKVFSLSNELNEIKDMLREIRRNTVPQAPMKRSSKLR